MFKHLTRTLKLGLTTLTILTAGGFAGTAFAQSYSNDRVGYCAKYPSSSLCPRQVDNCVRYPFGTNTYYYGSGGCARTFTAQELIVAKTRYCGKAGNVRKSVCRETLNRVSAATWTKDRLDNRRTISTRINTANRQSEFLQGEAAGLDDSGAILTSIWHKGALNFKTARFNGKALGGDATDGVSFFLGAADRTPIPGTNGRFFYEHFYSGILSGTDLGAPVTQTSGVASWVGQFTGLWFYSGRDFVLEVTFGNPDRNKAGSIQAFVEKNQVHDAWSHYYLNGYFDNDGLITGTITAGQYADGDRNGTTGYRRHGTLTGLIGQEGAVGAFIGNGGWFTGGFVARPADKDDQKHLNTICTSNSDNDLCFLSNQRAVKILTECDGTLPIPSHCTNATVDCVKNPFGETCHDILGGHALNIAQVQFCGRNETNQDSSKCEKIVGRATAANWASKNSDAPLVLDTAPYKNQFLRGTTNGVNETGIEVALDETLNLQTSTFNGEELGGDATDGISSFLGRITGNPHSLWYVYAGIFSGTDLGEFVNDNSGTASWVGKFSTPNYGQKADFVLEVDFDNSTLSAFVKDRYGRHARLTGKYDDVGIIKGDVSFGRYKNNDRNSLTGGVDPSILSGLIGKEGAVGVFITKQGVSTAYSGGFVARPANESEQTFLNETCGDATSNLSDPGDPFHEFCYLRKTEQTARIANCTVDSNADISACQRAVALNPCITNPFKSDCEDNADFRDFYPTATANRIEYCNNTGSAIDDPLCQYTEVVTAICEYSPFAPVCSDRLNTESEEIIGKFATCRKANPSDLTCHGVSKKPSKIKPDAATWLDGFVTIDNPNGLSSVVDINKSSQFLKASETGLDHTGITPRESDVLRLSDVLDNNADTSNELPSDVPAAVSEDGVAFFYAYNRGWKFAAGILSGTDLGAPVTRTNNTSAVWRGKFQSVYINTETFFDLNVNFSNSNNGTGTTGTIDAFIERSNSISPISWASSIPHYYIKGDFDAEGRITGRVIAGTFSDKTNPDIRTPGRSYYNGVLRGLIGEEGAVGAFIGGDSDDKGLTFDRTRYFAGGFVAVAELEDPCLNPALGSNCRVNYADWKVAANPLAVIGNSSGNQFLQGKPNNPGETNTLSDTPVEATSLTLANATYKRVSLGGDSADGVAFFKNPATGNNSSYYAGILHDTDLGLPIIQSGTSAEWKGSLQTVSLGGISPLKDFILTVNFDGNADRAGRIAAVVRNAVGSQSIHLGGTFDNNGVIRGTSKLGADTDRTENLIGLIGEHGAVGAFISTGGTRFSGGFVARPSVNATNLSSLPTLPRDLTNSGFLAASDTTGLLVDNVLPQGHTLSGQQMILRRDGDANDGIAYFFTTADNENANRSYGGILATTDLGAPVSATQASAVWKGHHSYRNSSNIDSKPTSFYVNFAAGTFEFFNTVTNKAGPLAITPFTSEVTFTLNGIFGRQNNIAVGQLGGTLDYVFDGGSTHAHADDAGIVRYKFDVHGLIGREGAVGVYLEKGLNETRVGGFVASAPTQ